MTTQTSPLFLKFLSAISASLEQLKLKMSHFWNNLSQDSGATNWPPLEELALTPLEEQMLNENVSRSQKHNTKWVLAETTDADNKNKNVVVVEVEYFNDTHIADLSFAEQPHIHNYTKDGEDPNLRITHYPSNRLH